MNTRFISIVGISFLLIASIVCPGNASAGFIDVGSLSPPWDAVVDGWRNENSSTAYHAGSADGSTGWGQYEGWGWFASRWQLVGDSSLAALEGQHLWIDNFNVLEAIFGDASQHQDITSQDLWSVENAFANLNLYVFNGSMSQGQEAIITDAQKSASIHGMLKLTSIGFAMDGRDGVMTLTGTVVEGELATLLGAGSSFSWTLRDWDNGTGLDNTNNVWNLLNPQSDHTNGLGNPHPQQHVYTQGTGGGGETPEPATMVLFGSAAGLVGLVRRRLGKARS